MQLRDPQQAASWQHDGARSGFEVAYFNALDDGWRIHGCTTAVENGQAWIVNYMIELDHAWGTRVARVSGRSETGHRTASLSVDPAGRWQIDGEPARHLDGCRDVDLESSVMTNAFPVRRLRLAVGARADAPAAYVRATGLAVERLDQTYERLPDETGRQRYAYAAPKFDFDCRITYDASGFVVDYPQLASRVA